MHMDYWLGMNNIDHFFYVHYFFSKLESKLNMGKQLFLHHITQHPVPSVFCCLALQTFKGCF